MRSGTVAALGGSAIVLVFACHGVEAPPATGGELAASSSSASVAATNAPAPSRIAAAPIAGFPALRLNCGRAEDRTYVFRGADCCVKPIPDLSTKSSEAEVTAFCGQHPGHGCPPVSVNWAWPTLTCVQGHCKQ